MNAAKLVNIFEKTKYFVQNLIYVHEFMNMIESLNKKIGENALLYLAIIE